MNYLKAQLQGEAKQSILGLAATNENYEIAIKILKERFGNKQQVIDAHYSALSNLSPATMQTNKLRTLFDNIEQHLHSLEALGEDVKQRHFISLIRAKLPFEVVFRLEETNGGREWTTNLLRERINQYLTARETAGSFSPVSSQKSIGLKPNEIESSTTKSHSTTEALLSSSAGNENSGPKCANCEMRHWSDKCRTFPTIEERKKKLLGNCFGCLKFGHSIHNCGQTKTCYYCKQEKSHHSSLCPKKFPASVTEDTTNVAVETSGLPMNVTTTTQSITEGSLLSSGESVLLQTATTVVQSTTNSKSISTRVLLDTGSQRSYITANLAKALNLKPKWKEKLSVFTFGTLPPKEIETSVVTLRVKLLDDSFLNLSANIVPMITGGIQRSPIDFNKIGPLYKTLPLADSIPSSKEKLSGDLLIGNDCYWDIITSEKIVFSKGLYFIGSKFGWILSGRHRTKKNPQRLPSTVLFTQSVAYPMISSPFVQADTELCEKLDIKTLGDLDTIGIIDRNDDTNDEEALQRFKDSIKYIDNRYYVAWPWKNNDVDLPTNYNLSLGPLNSMTRRFKNQPQFFANYQTVINNQLNKGIIEKVNQFQTNFRQHYLPHHAVITPDKNTTKLRIVYDGSAKTKKKNLSINECLYRGPVILDDLCRLLIRFRLNKVGLVADIEKAFHQIGLQETDRDVTRFLWLRDPKNFSTENNLQIYRFTKVPFGIISSPFLLGATITYHLKKDGSEIATKILNNIYVDNIITGVDSCEQAMEFYLKTKEMFRAASMNVREWVSNSIKFTAFLPACDRTINETSKVLGMAWNALKDTFSVNMPATFSSEIITKRSILKWTATIFDPLGLFSPVTILPKMFLQKLWLNKYEWDDLLPPEYVPEWQNIVAKVTPISDYTIPRFIGTDKTKDINYELHCFCDASQSAYGTCVYIRIITPMQILTHLLFAKSRVAPNKGMTLPRLELLAVFIGSRCMDFVASSFPFKIDQKFIWTDSQCVLLWIHSKKPLSVFVRNRINSIKRFENVLYQYVQTTENPADLASRGKSALDLTQLQIWWHGPTWLINQDKSAWPPQEFLSKIDDSSGAEENSTSITLSFAPEDTDVKFESPLTIDEKRYSSFTKLLRVTDWSMRFISRLKQSKSDSNQLTAEEINDSKFQWIEYLQKKHYADVLVAISENRRHPLKEQLDLWVDTHGLLRCGGRLTNSQLPELAIFPILIPKNDHITTLIICNFHRKLFHVGVSQTLAQIRNEYWIPSGRSAVFKFIRSCRECKKYDGGAYKMPPMPSLPTSRVTPSAPFTFTGIDYLGPLYYMLNEKTTQLP